MKQMFKENEPPEIKVDDAEEKEEPKPDSPIPASFVGRMRRVVRKEYKRREDNYYKYGPPYNAEYGGNIHEETNKPKMNKSDVHQLLLDGADPRIGDQKNNDNTALHNAVRFCRFDICKLLIRAGAQVDQQNELGVTALGMHCMFNQPEPRRKKHTKMCEWLIKQGANVNHTDRGGHTALEFAAAAGNMNVVTILLQNGARVTRNCKYLSMKMPSPLDVCDVNERVQRILMLRSVVERDELAKKEARQEAARKKELERLDVIRRQKERELKRKEKLKNDKVLKAKLAWLAANKQHNAKAKKAAMAAFSDSGSAYGVWRRTGRFAWELRHDLDVAAAQAEGVIGFSKALIEEQKRKGLGGAMISKRWKKITGTSIEKPVDAETFADVMSPTKHKQVERKQSDTSKFVNAIRNQVNSPLKNMMNSPARGLKSPLFSPGGKENAKAKYMMGDAPRKSRSRGSSSGVPSKKLPRRSSSDVSRG